MLDKSLKTLFAILFITVLGLSTSIILASFVMMNIISSGIFIGITGVSVLGATFLISKIIKKSNERGEKIISVEKSNGISQDKQIDEEYQSYVNRQNLYVVSNNSSKSSYRYVTNDDYNDDFISDNSDDLFVDYPLELGTVKVDTISKVKKKVLKRENKRIDR